MKRFVLSGVLSILPVLLAFAPCAASDHAREFFSAIESYHTGHYGKAADQFESLAKSGIRSGPLFYNLGNAYLKDRQLGPAMLWYERARHLMPNDPDLRFNLQYARLLAKDAPEESTVSWLHILFFWNFYLAESMVVLLALGFNGFFWLLLGIWYLTRRPGSLKAAIGTGAAALIFVMTAGANIHAAKHPFQGIVLPDQVSIRSGLEDNSTELFLLHAGARVRILEQRGEHYLVRFSAEKIGWVNRSRVGLIR
jgi:hypothetical protein